MRVSAEPAHNGYNLQILKERPKGWLRSKLTEAQDWEGALPSLHPATATVLDLLGQSGELAKVDGKARLLTFAGAAKLENQDAHALGLPEAFPFQLDIQSAGSLGTHRFTIQYEATQGGVSVRGTFSEGMFATADRTYRLADPLFSIIRAIDDLNGKTSSQDKIAAFAALRLLLPDSPTPDVNPENYLLRMRIAHVTAIGLSPTIQNGEVSFDPIPMRKRDRDDPSAGAEIGTTPAAADLFASEFRRQGKVNSTYALEPGLFVYIDPSVRTALKVVKEKQNGSIEQRMAFLMSPSRFISDAYAFEGADSENPVSETIFFETSQYSERVTGIGEWIPPELSYLSKESNNWLPERFSVVLAGKLVTGVPDDVPDWIAQVKSAMASNQDQVTLGGVAVPTASPKLLETLLRLQPPESVPTGGDEPGFEKSAGEEDALPRRRLMVLRTKDNFDTEQYKREFKSRDLKQDSAPIMRTALKSHQLDGLGWMTQSYHVGWPGVLLADDMGLGKTLQSLAFLVLLRREGLLKKGQPALVVAPTSLLQNWQDEHKKHTIDGGLGEPLVAFGRKLAQLKLGAAPKDGVVLLDTQQISDSTWVLTTYETIRDYHLSFARVPFSVCILDEVQKAKNPATRIHASLKSLNCDFVLSMSGTPVENSISDLWAITDLTAPGYLGPLKTFITRYGSASPNDTSGDPLEALSRELLDSSETNGTKIPPFALRRLKEDVAKDLPKKLEGPMLRGTMPPQQAERYAEVSAATQAGRIKILRALHDFRSISLHPVDPESVSGGLIESSEYIGMSARLKLAFEHMDQIALRQEKVIIFVHSRRMQTLLSRLIERRYGCKKPEFIRGDTIAGQRQEIVNKFSALQGFAALILSPRAAGVGLNIVAANHVIHLDRWWNPAVEDQCTDRAYRIGATKDVHVYTIGAVHPQLQDSSYDVVLDNLLRARREKSKKIFVASEIFAADLMDAMRVHEEIDANKLLSEIDASGYLGLEEFVRDRLLAEGYFANLTKTTGDGGADIVVRDRDGQITLLVQCKFTANLKTPVDGGIVGDAYRVRETWRAPAAVVVGVTNGHRFAPRVIEAFNSIGGRLIQRDELCRLRFAS